MKQVKPSSHLIAVKLSYGRCQDLLLQSSVIADSAAIEEGAENVVQCMQVSFLTWISVTCSFLNFSFFFLDLVMSRYHVMTCWSKGRAGILLWDYLLINQNSNGFYIHPELWDMCLTLECI